ncbi:hypothetical protein [Herbiconiux ginsengi]|uniref:Uncharacterized protein n=1 Tax=Herbiconiux ginsengi TaxID=381665 RepID=A0A1H3KT52_9MICO|nr:hypothetical protein [Herbiconiux ginsengi]SDY55291.1 hypothetical protein SAMN05216554_0685 [Herbiconiux ginsengi]
MSYDVVIRTVLILLVVGWICYRQTQWRAVVIPRMWRSALLFTVIGLVQIGGTTSLGTVSAFDVGVMAIEIVISLGVGAVMGWIAHFRPVTEQALAAWEAKAGSRGRPSAGEVAPIVESRTGWWGIGLWLVFIAVRLGMDVWAGAAGSQLAVTVGAILIVVAANRAARTLVFMARIERMRIVAA